VLQNSLGAFHCAPSKCGNLRVLTSIAACFKFPRSRICRYRGLCVIMRYAENWQMDAYNELPTVPLARACQRGRAFKSIETKDRQWYSLRSRLVRTPTTGLFAFLYCCGEVV
jgi:hypothetical protein